VGVLVLVLVCVGVNVAVGGTTVSVGGGWVGVNDGSGESSVVISGVGTTTSGADSVGELVLQPAKINPKSRIMKIRFLRSSVIDFIC